MVYLNNFSAYKSQEFIVIGFEDSSIAIYSVDGTLFHEEPSLHSTRVKDLDILNEHDILYLCTCSSDGVVKLWNLGNSIDEKKLILIKEYNAKCRLTCLKLSGTETQKPKKEINLLEGNESQSEYEDMVVYNKKAKVTVVFENKESFDIKNDVLPKNKKTKGISKNNIAVDDNNDKKKEKKEVIKNKKVFKKKTKAGKIN